MSLYNMLFGTNPQSPILKAVLGLDQDDGKYPTGRFRDIYIEGDYIVLYTRNGGSNRRGCCIDEYGDKSYVKDGRCECPVCCINKILPTHPNYHHDKDYERDITYNNCYFTKPESAKDWEDLRKAPADKWNDLFKEMESGKHPTSEEGKRAADIGERIIGEIKKKIEE